MKILISKNINIDIFCKDPILNLEKTKNGAMAIFKNNNLVFYAITPNFFKEIFNIDTYINHKKNDIFTQKFSMHNKWKPDNNFIRQAALWGIILKKPIKFSELASFISYWKAEGCMFYHVQWQQKFARSLQKTRYLDSFKTCKRNITDIPKPDAKTPTGFRGE